MSLKSSEKIDTNLYELVIDVDGETFNNAINQAFQKQRKNITIPGFRKGKATRGMVERYYGEGVFYEDAFEIVYPDAVEEAVKEAGLEIVDNPFDVDFKEVGKDGLTFSLKATVKPEVEIGDYKSLELKKPIAEVTDEDVDAELATMQERGARFVEVDREAKLDDMTVIDFEGFVDDVAFEGGKGEGYELTLGSGQFIPGFEDQIVGHKVGEEFDVNVKFPEDYVEELAAKDAVFKVKLNAIKEKQLPELDDDFAMDVSEYDTLAEYKEHIKEDLAKTKADAAEAEVDSQIFEKLAGLLKAEIPEVMFEHEVDNAVQDFGYQIQSQGLDLQTYLAYTGMTEEALRDSFRERAENQVKVRLALEKIAELEKFDVTDEDVDAQYNKLAEQYEMDVETIKSILPAEDIKKDVSTTKALDIVKETATITEVDANEFIAESVAEKVEEAEEKAEEKKPAKKTTAKKTTAKKTTAKKTTAKKEDDGEKKPAAKKTTAKKTTTKKADDGEKKPAAKKTTAKKTTAKKTTKKADDEKAE
ncbi:MAG: trigger factor [Clostridia bacterium]|nr:trigger factor [Clostridia bacterium]